MKKHLKKIVQNEDGAILVLVALMMFFIMGFAALVIDVGMLYQTKAKLQNAADAAALAGAQDLQTDYTKTAKDYAKLNGVDETVAGTAVKVEFVPASAATEATTVKTYTEAEIEAKRTELTTELNDTNKTSDDELIALAVKNSVTVGLTTTGNHTTAELTGKTDAELIKLANDNSVTTDLTTTPAQLTDYLNGLPDSSVIGFAQNHNIDTSKYWKKDNTEFQNKNDRTAAINAIVAKLGNDKTIKDRPALIDAIVAIPTTTTITDKSALVTAIVNKLIDALSNEVTVLGGMQDTKDGVKVTCTKEVSYTFAQILGFTKTTVTAHAVAVNSSWTGDALPFINLDGLGEDSPKGGYVDAWDKVGPGDKERIYNDDLVISPDKIKVKYEDGFIKFKKGKDMSQIKDPLKKIVVVGKTVYLISLKHIEMPNYAKKGSKELKNGDLIPTEDTVLLKCEVTDGWDGTGSDLIDLKFIDSYAWDASKKTYVSATGEDPGGSVKLVE